eukprot:NODE_516_length_2126_cov_135.727364_g477_i0.p1 GENE.NODE_516_length_2126_cov_135.727364_g477_i0~~NODE_516_length_2126_cov_135.727364_g477_i0.p1  ORF type:complete len:644 (+),score=222.17 NODE_516_length_2126_cov_135.727364_g477_i0:82-2013(+)
MYSNYIPREYVEGGRRVNTEISGRDRPKFFKRPVVPHLDPNLPPESQIHLGPARAHGVVPNTHFQPSPVGTLKQQSKPASLDHKEHLTTAVALGLDSGTHTVMCQTDYRENDCQTDPFTPDYYVEDGKNPEVLAIMTLKCGEGLPAGLAEVEMIDRVRRRKQVEMNLPQGSDDASMKKRLEQLEALEQIEWNEREQHIRELQDERLKQTAEALEKRERRREEESTARIDTVHQKKLQATQTTKDKFKVKRQKAARMLENTYKNPTKTLTKRDIIGDYSTHGTRGKQVETRTLVEKMRATNYDVRPTLLGFPEGVQELERTEAPKIQKIRKSDTRPPPEIAFEELPTHYRKRQAKQVIQDLEFANQTILKSKQGPAGTTSIQDLYRATPRLIRPDTPTLVLEGDDEEEKEEALILLQRLLRGRSVQNDFFEGKERCHGLIEELQAAQKAKESEHKYMPQIEVEKAVGTQHQVVEGVLDSIQGDIIYTTLDYLAKELIRQREAAKFEQLRLEAETTRAQREEAEKQRRAEEEQLRLREDKQCRQVQCINDYTIHTYLTGLLTSCIDHAAYETALDEQIKIIRLEEAEAVSEPKTKEDEVCELMLHFIIPQVQKEINKTKSEYSTAEKAKAMAAHLVARQLIECIE